ncbi:bifunctional NUDIX hydrolase/phosphatase PAP2 family protein [Photobacterium gaetbulicola]|uniref:bifunctional NUDIX hydrolase/phosphatase PAP2 family protein n=1 Tax=Photobacterium gaetbulicola TaxID=1295392 RepID=UPI0018CC98CB|nr:phosphatase PAP2 family protein [Photobacterium gaetbulicola]
MKSNLIIQYFALVLLSVLSFSTVADQSSTFVSRQPDDIVGAVCVIRNGDNLILLSEVITNKLSLPGGYIDKGDTPEQAAAREALEETGIEVDVEHLIQYRGRAAIFACKATSPILVSSFKDHRGYLIVASWFAKHYATEVERVYLIDPSAIEAGDYRYVEDAALLPLWLAQTPESEINFYERFAYPGSTLLTVQLGWIEQFQHHVSTWPASLQWLFEGMMHGVSVVGEPWFAFIMVAIMAGYLKTPILLEIAFLFVVALFGASLLKHGLMMPRPYFIVPELQQVNASGFGFPSVHILMTSILLGVLGFLWQGKLSLAWQKAGLAILIILLVLAQGIARVWFGVQFISDVILSLMLSFALVAMFIVWRTGGFPYFQLQLTNHWFWLGYSVLLGMVASLSLVPQQAYLFALVLGGSLAVAPALQVSQLTPALSRYRKVVASVMVLLGASILYSTASMLATMQTGSLVVLAIKALGHLVLGAWLVYGSAWVRGQLSRSREWF